MRWNWQQSDWPCFRYDPARLKALEARFLHQSGLLLGTVRHIHGDDKNTLTVDLISNEALKTSEIEGETLNRDSLQSSIRREFGLESEQGRILPAEKGIAEMMVDLYRHSATPLANETLFRWHTMLMGGRRNMKDMGCYRTHTDPMQVVSGPLHKPNIHFEAPPSQTMPKEMDRFIAWFNQTAPDGSAPVPPLVRAGIAHLYFVSIHPFEDGNGRLGRALAEKTLAQYLGHPTLIALSQTIQKDRKRYYRALAENNRENEITDWLVYFAGTILDAQARTQRRIDFLIEKAKLYETFRGQLNERHEKVIARLFREGPDGFKGGLSAGNYIAITGTSRATATRDLQDLVEKGVLSRTGERKGTRYHLNLTASA